MYLHNMALALCYFSSPLMYSTNENQIGLYEIINNRKRHQIDITLFKNIDKCNQNKVRFPMF